ncbi:alpha/beta fold hydrolase [Nocardioides humi]|uniref:Alpha/beta hydrolase n=1 Tax=Nocardioides humi TaxID=449461 RepID=A0ABN1ZNN2_9ACTN|nr:alpha/beta hydrolase [Nocardioides humi]
MKITLHRSYVVLALLVALVGGVLLATASTSASVPGHNDAKVGKGAKPTVVLVHGAWADASGWQREVERLTSAGYPVIAPANPLRGLSSDATYLRGILETIPGPVVLVGHSYGGAVISNAATGLSNVKALVYIAAFVPAAGEPVAQLAQQFPGSLATEDALDARPYSLPNGDQGVDLYLKSSIFREAFAGDLPQRTTTVMQASQRPFSLAAFTEPSAEPAWKTTPSWYLLATNDKTIPPAAQEFMAKRAGARIVKVRSSHVAMQSHPDATLALIKQAISSVR